MKSVTLFGAGVVFGVAALLCFVCHELDKPAGIDYAFQAQQDELYASNVADAGSSPAEGTTQRFWLRETPR